MEDPPRGDKTRTLALHVELLRRRDGLGDRAAIKSIAAQQLVTGKEETLRKRYKNVKKGFAPISAVYDQLAATIGKEAFIQIMEKVASWG